MEPITLRPKLLETLEKDAKRQTKSVNDVVNEAVEYYLREQQRSKLDLEVAAYEDMHSELRKTYLGQWVAIHNQQLVDSDTDRIALYFRIRRKYGQVSILLRQVKDQPVEEIWVRTPCTGKISA